MRQIEYPPDLSDEELSDLVCKVKDWQLCHGSLLKLVGSEDEHTVLARPIGVTLFPSPFPEYCFESARALCPVFNELYSAVAEDEDWLYETLKDLIETDVLVAALWSVHSMLKEHGYGQDVTLGLFRSDYMLCEPRSPCDRTNELSLKQVEFNTYSCAGGIHSNKVSNMHRFLCLSGAYNSQGGINTWQKNAELPFNRSPENLVRALVDARNTYDDLFPEATNQTAVLFVVQGRNVNICDERPLEYALWDNEPSVPAFRVVFGEEIIERCSLGSSKELLFRPSGSSLHHEISVVYLRAGYDTEEFYHEHGKMSRLLLERSRAIKCPSLLSQLATTKKVQQALSMPGSLEHFIDDPHKLGMLRSSFMPMYPLDDETELGLKGRSLALDPRSAADHILKPSLEGGGHNVFGESICEFLQTISEQQWQNYILMETIRPPLTHNYLMSPFELCDCTTVSELGIFGACLWRRREGSRDHRSPRRSVISNSEAGWSLKTKRHEIDEMSVVKGFGCFTSPILVSEDDFLKATVQI